MKILIAVDESETARHATRVARLLFPESEHIVLGAAELPPFVFGVPLGGFSVGPSDALTTAIEESVQSNVADAAELLPDGTKLAVEAGDAAMVICSEAARLGVDVVVVGRETRSAVSRLLHPSVSDYVMKNAPCPVLIVREGTDEIHPDTDGAMTASTRLESDAATIPA